MFTNKVNAASFGVGKEKEAALTIRVQLTQEFEEMLKLRFITSWSQWTRKV